MNKVQIELPPLRERKDDIEMLINHFIKKSNNRFNKDIKGISKEGLNLLKSYSWPGNVRELENLIERIILTVKEDRISAQEIKKYLEIHPPPETAKEGIDTSLSLAQLKDKLEKDYLINMLKKYYGNIKLISEKSGVSQKNHLCQK